jgi:ATP-dependent exoDNAse (exonuclease V) beta subunit
MTLPSLDFRNEALAASFGSRSLVVSASAGSGKTFALVTLVLGFLGRGGRAPQVIATTFGREAAADLRARILQPLDQLAAWKPEVWSEGLGALRTGFETWDAWLASQPGLRPEIGAAARQWRLAEGWPDWAVSPAKAREHWIRTRREAELLQATTVHALAQGTLRARGQGVEALLEADDPVLVRLLRAAGRGVLELPDDDPDEAAARRLWAWCEGFEQDRDRWHLLAAAFDAHLDALGTWRESLDAAIPRERFLWGGQHLLEAYAPFAQEPLRAAALTKQGKPLANFTKIGLGNLEPEPGGDTARLLEALERLASRFLKEDGAPPNYYSEAFATALEPLGTELPEHLEAWMTLLLERVFQRFRDLKTERGFRSYGDLVRDAWKALLAAPDPEPPALLLVDEYQDINPVQQAFLEVLGAERTVLVGDPKQAIYGFRGGVPELLREKLRAADRRGEAFRLPVNHRSSAPVVELANTFVRSVVPALDPASADPDGLQGHTGTGEGECRVALGAVPSGKTRGGDLPAAAAWVAALARPEGWAASGFQTLESSDRRRALLLPRRTGLPALRRSLQALHIEPLVQSREGFWDSPGVRLLMALLEATARPEADTARDAVLRSPWVGATNGELLAHRNNQDSERIAQGLAWLRALAQGTTQRLVAEALTRPGLLELLGATAVHGALEPARARRNLERFLGWIPGLPEAPALAWSELERLRGLRDPGDAPAEEAAADLVVQTIHGAKGLEYDDVILPLLASDVKGVRKGTIRQRPGDPGCLWIGWKLGNARGPALRELQGEESGRIFREGLNLLYVGLTRARGRMALLQQWPLSKEGAPEPPPSGAERLADHKGVQWHHVGSDLREALPELRLLEAAPVMSRGPLREAARLLPPQARVPVEAPMSVPTGDSDRVRKGIRIHALLREVLVRAAEDLAKARTYLAAHPLLREWPEAARLVEGVLDELAARSWDRLPRRTEFELSGGSGRADLVLWEPDRREPDAIHVIDFKLAAAFPPEALDLHRLQLAAYREALTALHPDVPVSGWVVGLEGGGWVKLL